VQRLILWSRRLAILECHLHKTGPWQRVSTRSRWPFTIGIRPAKPQKSRLASVADKFSLERKSHSPPFSAAILPEKTVSSSIVTVLFSMFIAPVEAVVRENNARHLRLSSMSQPVPKKTSVLKWSYSRVGWGKEAE